MAASSERWIRKILLAAAALSTATAFSIFIVLLYLVAPLLSAEGLSRVFSWQWRPYEGQFGILPMVAGSLMLSMGALFLACPPALGLTSLTMILGDGRAARFIGAVIHYMTSIPTVIYGFVSVFLLVPLIRDGIQHGTGFSLLAALLTLSLLILPTIVLVFQARLKLVHPSVHLTAVALGIPHAAYVRRVLLPLSGKGFVIAAILGFGRALGDTLISLMLAGNAPIVPRSLLDSFRSLTAHIGLVVATDSQSTFYHSVFASGLILFLIMAVINLVVRRLGKGRDWFTRT